MSGPQITLSRQALAANLLRARELAGDTTQVMLAVKSNAYGHGMEHVVQEAVAAGVDAFAVLDLPTALAVHAHAPETPLLAWLFGPHTDYTDAVTAGVHLGVSTQGQLDDIATHRAGTPAIVHLKVDTGLNRNGATAAQWPELVARAADLEASGVLRVHAVWSHLADTSAQTSREALQRLLQAVDVARAAGLNPPLRHLAASHALIDVPEARLEMVRLGILAYGVSPVADRSAEALGFHPVMTVHAPVIEVNAERLVLGIGSSHGLLSPTDATAHITLHGERYSIQQVGIDQTSLTPPTADSATPALSPGETVPILGAAPGAPSIEEWAGWCGTIGDEVLVALRPEIPRSWED